MAAEQLSMMSAREGVAGTVSASDSDIEVRVLVEVQDGGGKRSVEENRCSGKEQKACRINNKYPIKR